LYVALSFPHNPPLIPSYQTPSYASNKRTLTQFQEGYFHPDPVALAGAVCNDLPWPQAYENTLNFAHHSSVSFEEKVTAAAYETTPVGYVLCEKDVIVSPEKQQGFIEVLKEGGREVKVEKLDAGHCPNWSCPERLAEVLGEMAVE
jgi:pimeloyl-ACP methyl ester carboxylesterase